MNKNCLYYQKPVPADPNQPEQWNNALPIGNGALGAMVYGGVETERLQLNEDTLWHGGAGRDRVSKDALTCLPVIRKLLAEGKIREAQRLTKLGMMGGPEHQRNYTTAGDLLIDFEMDKSEHEAYSRTLDLEEAIASIHYKCGKTSFSREVFSSAVHKIIAMRIVCDQPGELHLAALFDRWVYQDENRAAAPDTIVMQSLEGGKDGVGFCAALKICETDGEVFVLGNHLILEKASGATLLLTVRTSFYGDDPMEWCMKTLDEASALPYSELKKAHTEEYRGYFDRMSFALTGDEEYSALPTDVRLSNVKNGMFDPGLVSLYYNFGRYLLISCSRPGTQAANLQGIWNKDFIPPWGGKYTININTEMNYWPAESSNLSECTQPLFDLLMRMLPNGRKVAQEMYGCKGFTAHHNTDIYGDCAPQDLYLPATVWPMGAAWLCTHIWEHYLFTEDLDFLRQYYVLLYESSLFFTEYMFLNEQGQLVTGPSVSPENTYIHPSGERGTVCIGPSMDSQIITDVFHACIQAASLLNAEDDLIPVLRDMLTRMPKPSVGRYGQLMEWAQDYEEAEPGHRHISHLYSIYPSAQVTFEKDPALLQAARVTLERRLANGGGHTGWSRAWIIAMWARLRDGDKAGQNVQALLAKSTSDNLFDMHPPFQIDGNFGATAGITEMLLQSHDGVITFLPALPSDWSEGSIRGIKARGRKTIAIEWKENLLTLAEIRNEKSESFIVSTPVRVSITGTCLTGDCKEDILTEELSDKRYRITTKAASLIQIRATEMDN